MVFDILQYKTSVGFYVGIRLQRGVHMDLNQFQQFWSSRVISRVKSVFQFLLETTLRFRRFYKQYFY